MADLPLKQHENIADFLVTYEPKEVTYHLENEDGPHKEIRWTIVIQRDDPFICGYYGSGSPEDWSYPTCERRTGSYESLDRASLAAARLIVKITEDTFKFFEEHQDWDSQWDRFKREAEYFLNIMPKLERMAP